LTPSPFANNADYSARRRDTRRQSFSPTDNSRNSGYSAHKSPVVPIFSLGWICLCKKLSENVFISQK